MKIENTGAILAFKRIAAHAEPECAKMPGHIKGRDTGSDGNRWPYKKCSGLSGALFYAPKTCQGRNIRSSPVRQPEILHDRREGDYGSYGKRYDKGQSV